MSHLIPCPMCQDRPRHSWCDNCLDGMTALAVHFGEGEVCGFCNEFCAYEDMGNREWGEFASPSGTSVDDHKVGHQPCALREGYVPA